MLRAKADVYFRIVFCLVFLVPANLYGQGHLKTQNKHNGIYMYSTSAILYGFVRTAGFLPARQSAYAVGVKIGYGNSSFQPYIKGYFHESIMSQQNSFVCYRNYSGYNLSVGGQKSISTFYDKSKIIAGSSLGITYDKFNFTSQYMVYPAVEVQAGFEFYASWKSLVFPISCTLPMVYAFRKSGRYIQTGVAINLGAKL